MYVTQKKIWLMTMISTLLLGQAASASTQPATKPEKEAIWNADAEDVNAEVGAGDERVPYEDSTDFYGGFNGWDFMGRFSKYDLTQLTEDQRIVPLNEERDDQYVFICHVQPIVSILEKEFPAIEDAKLTLSYYISAKENFTMRGMAQEKARDAQKEIFSFSYPMDLHEQDKKWVAQSFNLGNFTNEFQIKIILTGDNEGIWATDEMKIEGYKPKSAPIVVTEKPSPQENATQKVTTPANVNATESTLSSNVTVEVNATTLANNVTVDVNATVATVNVTGNSTGNGTDIGSQNNVTESGGNNVATSTEGSDVVGKPGQSSSLEENVSKLAGVAQAIWDAFYVFLALFCACLVAIVGLIVRGRCKDDANPPPSVATYNPRTASYRLDKVYDNRGYETNPV